MLLKPKQKLKRVLSLAWLLICLATLVACHHHSEPKGDYAPKKKMKAHRIKDAKPLHEPKSKQGNPARYTVLGKTYYPMNSSQHYQETGIASWYGSKFHGRLTSNGETYNMYDMTAAHKTLPLPSYVKVTNLDNGKTAVVKINDRGPFHDDRLIDLSYAAATKLGVLEKGTARVRVESIDPRDHQKKNKVHQAQYIQVAAFSDKKRANQLRQKLQAQLDEPVFIQSFRKDNITVYRVKVGPLHPNKLHGTMAQLEHFPDINAQFITSASP